MANATANKEINESKITYVMGHTGCNRETAIAYLEAEEWDAIDAVGSYKVDN